MLLRLYSSRVRMIAVIKMEISCEKLSKNYLEVNSCERQFLSDQDYTMLRERGRVDYHILYITKGFCITEFDGKEYRVGAGNIILYMPHERQKYSFNAVDGSVSCYIHFSGTGCEEILKRFGFLGKHIIYVGLSSKLENIFTRMADEYALKKEFYVDSCTALLWQFLAVAGRFAKYHRDEINIVNENAVDNVCRYMHKNFSENNDVKFYADMCNLSVSRFTHVFKASTGTSPRQYVIKIKLDIAQQLLENTNLGISEIAMAVGIEDGNYFSRLVKKRTGHSPKYFKG